MSPPKQMEETSKENKILKHRNIQNVFPWAATGYELNHLQIDHSIWPLGFKWVSRHDNSMVLLWYFHDIKRGNFFQGAKRKRYNNLLALVATWLLFDLWPWYFYDITMIFLWYLLWGFILYWGCHHFGQNQYSTNQ